MVILHGIKSYGFMVGDTTIKIKYVTFYSECDVFVEDPTWHVVYDDARFDKGYSV